MKVFIDKDNHEYLEVKPDGFGNVDLSIRTSENSKGVIITAKLKREILDKLISNLILLKSKLPNE